MGWTSEQQKAISIEGGNVLVSAGAGSGKTAVLTERVKRKLLDGIHVDNLLVLTFTNAAAEEMKNRIRKAIKKANLRDELKRLDGAYIMTFDAFSLALVKKYHTRLNISPNIKVSDQIIVDMKTKEILANILDEYYLHPTPPFKKLIHDFCLKRDDELQKSLFDIYEKITLRYDKDEYLEHYSLDTDFYINEYLNLLLKKQDQVRNLIQELKNYFEEEFVLKIENNFSRLCQAKTYDEFLASLDYASISLPRGTEGEGKEIKQAIYDTAKEIRELCVYSGVSEMQEELESTFPYIEVIFEILKELDKRLALIKKEEGLYTFTDIQQMAIEIVEDNLDVRDELTEKFQEILIDEYQDTSDIQERFVSLIANNNIYMVGDIKQSIYRFRHANPDLFKEKYAKYSIGDNGTKIDLLKNFRSRKEVLDDINYIFNKIMDLTYGGALYQESHQMNFGNELYLGEGAIKDNSHMEFFTYSPDKLENISKDEEEAYIIGLDIKKKINDGYKVFDKDSSKLRNCQYKDFAILLDKGKNFDLYKKVFEYLQLPLKIIRDESFKDSEDIMVIRNLFRFLICIREERFDMEFQYSFTSIARSFLYQMKDEDIFHYIKTDSIKESELYKKCFQLVQSIDTVSAATFFLHVLNEFSYDEKVLLIGDVESHLVRVEYLYNLCLEYQEKGNTIYDFISYLNAILDEDYDLRFHAASGSDDAIIMMTIHKSKGLEFPICYYAGLYSKFNMQDMKSRIIYDNRYGLVLPKVNNYYKDTILKTLLKYKNRKEEISEKIRLFYVALTRAREKMIFVIPSLEEGGLYNFVPDFIREKYSSFLGIIKSIYPHLISYAREVDSYLTKDYLLVKKDNNNYDANNTILEVNELNINVSNQEETHYSKESITQLTKDDKEVMDFGTKVHAILEEIDFNNYDLSLYDVSENVKNKINSFIHSEFMSDKLNFPMYKEYEFVLDGEVLSHGIIDLLIDCGDYYTIVDYKLKNIDDSSYDKQLNGYRKFITKKTGKNAKCFLYSILDEVYREINYEE